MKEVHFSSWLMLGKCYNSNFQTISLINLRACHVRYWGCSIHLRKSRLCSGQKIIAVQESSNTKSVSYNSFGILFWYMPPQLRLAEERLEEAEARAQQLEKQVIRECVCMTKSMTNLILYLLDGYTFHVCVWYFQWVSLFYLCLIFNLIFTCLQKMDKGIRNVRLPSLFQLW